MKAIDTHTHISSKEFDSDRDEVMTRAFQVCDYLIDIGSGMSIDAFEKAKTLAETHEKIYFTAGVHPHDAATAGLDLKLRSDIEKIIQHPKCAAVGECGLDYFYENSPREAQQDTFKWHIDLAKKYKMPLMIHTRDAEEDTKKLLTDYEGPAVFHCFTGSQDLASFGVKKGFIISFSGIVTFKNAEALRQVFLNTPIENIVIETDAPFLAPVPMRGKRNESAFIQHTAEFLAKLRGMKTDEFIQATSKNALNFFSAISSQ